MTDSPKDLVDELGHALIDLSQRLDIHFGGPDYSQDWEEQEQARAAITRYRASKDKPHDPA